MNNTNIDNHTTDLIVRYLGGMLGADEKRELEAWASRSADNARYLRRQCELWVSSGASAETGRFDVEAAYRRFERSVEAEQAKVMADEATVAADADASTARPRWMRRIAAAAAVVLLVAGLATGAFYMGRSDMKAQLADISVTAPQGSNSEVVLPDGTHVWLNSGTTLSYSQSYGIDDRSVRINGEGYFEVKRNQDKPFTVSSKDMNVRVLGTKFNYSDCPDDVKATVTLAEGRVAMRGNRPGGEYVLTPGQRAVLDKHTGRVVIEACHAADDIAWTSGTISFEGQTLYEIAATLSKVYDMDVHVATARAGRKRFYGDFSRRGQSATDIVRDLCRTSDITYTVRGRSITIR